MFFVLMFLLYMGNMYYLKAKINSVVSQEAITYAARFADPNQEQFDKTIPTSNQGDTQVTKELYRYLDVFNISDYGTASDVQKSELIKEIEDTGFYAGMTPANITVETHKVHNYVVYQTYEVTVNYQLKFPIRFIFSKDVVLLNMTAHEETPVIDTSEFIRNVDMAVDYVERTETGQSILTTLDNTYARIEKFIDGEKKPDPSEAVAGGVLSEQYVRSEDGKIGLKPNNSYESNGYWYKTDEKGRIIEASGTLRLESAKRNPYAQSNVGGDDRIKGVDDGGHLIGSQFGGSGNIDNLVPMNSKINQNRIGDGRWYKMEKEWADKLNESPPVKVDVQIQVIYEGDSQRPKEFIITYSYDNIQQEPKRIPNEER